MKLPTLYKKTSSGKIQEWTIEVSGSAYRTYHGQRGGKIVTTDWFSAEPTNVGRSNHRTAEEQAAFEANACWTKKIDSGAVESLKDVGVKEFHTPMLAKKWEDYEARVDFPLFSQPKLDGLRAVITKDGAKSRAGKTWVTIPHILRALVPFFEKYPDAVLDGELYTHEYKDDFNRICSLVKKTKPTATDLNESRDKVQYWVYDIFGLTSEQHFSRRHAVLRNAIKKINASCVVFTPTQIVSDRETLDELYGAYLDDGYEGQMVRVDAPYENKRSSSLLKRKTFSDEEYLIVDICEGNGNKTGMAGYAVMERDDGVRFRSNIKGQHAFLRDLLSNRLKYIGTYGTVKYFNLTPGGIPRFPYLIALRNGKSID